MGAWIWVGLGSAIGGIARYGVGRWLPTLPGAWPLATMLINVAGSLLIGACSVWLGGRGGGAPEAARLFWMTGVLGGFTTFSAFALEATALGSSANALRAAAYVMVTVVLCLAAALVGRWLAGLNQ